MNFWAIVKRVAPFFATFAFGLLVASFFVSVAAPSFQFKRKWRSHREYHRQMEAENARLRAENCRLKKAVAEQDTRRSASRVKLDEGDLNLLVPPPPPLAPEPRRDR